MDNVLFERGFQLFQVKKYNEAIRYLQEGLQKDPEDYLSKNLLIKCYLELEDYQKAESLNELLISEYPNEDDLFYNRSVIERHNENNTEAKKAIDEAIRLNPYEPDYFGYKGFLFLESKQYQPSLNYANKGLELDPNNVLCLNVRAQALTKLKRKEEAQETIGNTLNQDPEGSFSHANVGWVQLEHGNHKEAMTHFKESLKNDPTSRYAQEGMLEAIKAKNFVYRGYLKYAFWMSNKSSKNQFAFIIGLFIVYRILVKVLESSGNENMAYIVIIPYLIFVLGGWIVDPLSNMILRFNSFGKYLLTNKQKVSGVVFFILLVLGTFSIVSYFIWGHVLLFLISISFFASIIPASKGILVDNRLTKIVSFAIVGYTFFMGFFGFLFIKNLFWLGASVPLGVVAYTWIYGLLKE
ncbi:tetratricopeptide repeat protein [Aquimarina sp. MMG016]|uniref:tetratricopeptide repeat protein n=1 Tax=Aquimarina sp. MMG016 TaxID=2822690 RepID=UPI001B3A7153|nr:tetratricopeptide repeat protein [Aquimarina sp. MMG016]MBQ4822694.1 tetratricopeptide repeat protein [Aquimarina sp. MMG016]